MASGTGLVSSTARLHAAFSKTIPQRCAEIAKIIEDVNLKEFHTALPLLLENIFGYGSHMGWGIGRITKSHSQDFSNMFKLLKADGPVLSLVYKLMQDPYYRYEFPITCLPYPSRRMIQDGGMPSLYVSNVQYSQGANKPYNMLLLNAFELYFYHFSYFLVNPSVSRMSPWTNPSDSLYPVLLENYFNYFLPVNGKSVPTLQSTKQPVRSPVHSPRFQSPLRQGGYPHLMSPQGRVAISEPMEQETCRSQTFLQILVEFWLNQNGLDTEKYAFNQQVTESFLPTGDHVRVVRMLVKHMHYFTNSAKSEIVTSPYSVQVPQPFEEFKRMALPQLVQKRLYSFIRHGFERWPLDSSFRLMLETWLSYLQPWRYTDATQATKADQEQKDRMVEDKWRPFISENLLFYTVMFHEFLHRVFRMDMAAHKNAYMLFRVSKVLNLPNLREILEDVEVSLFEPVQRLGRVHPGVTQDLGASYLSPSNRVSILSMHFTELEGPTFQYKALFSEYTYKLVQQLLTTINQAKGTVQNLKQKTSDRQNTSFWASLFNTSDMNTTNFSMMDGYDDLDRGSGDLRKLEIHLDQTTNYLCNFFQLAIPEEAGKTVTWGHSGGQNGNHNQAPDIIDTEDGPKLSPLGRYQLMNGLRKFDIHYCGDPDLQPIRSYEIAFLVRMFYQLSDFFNQKFGRDIEELYKREDIVGRLAYQLFQPPSSYSPGSKANKHTTASPLSKHQRALQSRPRISLRWLANYRNLGYLAVVFMLCYTWWGMGPVAFVFFMLLCGLSYGMLMALLPGNTPKLKYN